MSGTETVMSREEEALARLAECSGRLAAATRVAAEAMKLLSQEQLAGLRRTLDALEVGDSGKDRGD